MNPNTKTLIAVGASVAVNCRPCTEYHLAQARAVDVARDDLAVAVKIGLQVNAGAHGKTRQWSAELLDGTSAESQAGCGCG